MGVICAGTFGCAAASGSTEGEGSNERKAPPEVADHTVDEGSDSNPTMRPRVDVEIDRGELVGVEMTSYESTVRRKTQHCYSRHILHENSKAEGGMVYEVLVTRNGRVAGTDLMSTDIENDAIQSCAEQAMGRLHFDVSIRDRPVFRLFFRFDFYLETVVPSEPPV